jgi:cyanophycinase
MARSSRKNGTGNGNGNGNGHRNGNGRRAARPKRSPQTVPIRPGQPVGEARGTLIIIGGHEDKEGDRLILRAVAERAGGGKLVVATVASTVPDELWETYRNVFHELGVKHVEHLHVESRLEAKEEKTLRILDGATGVFFTGGDQLKLTSQLGDSPIYSRLKEIYDGGGLVAGTSAGASVVCETMLVSGGGSESHRIGGSLQMAPGFGLIPGVIIDQHFAERGRLGRLVAAVTQNPRILGVGIDENTAIVCDPQYCFRVLGEGAVYVVDGADVTHTNLTEEETDRTLSTFNVRLHLLSQGDEFDLSTRVPASHPAEALERELVGAKQR